MQVSSPVLFYCRTKSVTQNIRGFINRRSQGRGNGARRKALQKMKNAKGCFGIDVAGRSIRSYVTQLDTRRW